MLRSPFAKLLSLYLIAALFALSVPAPGWAMLVPAAPSEARSADLARLRSTLESSIVRQRLIDYGLSPEETSQRLNALSDKQVHQLAANLDAVQAGGSVLGDVIVILLLAVIVIVVLEATGHHVVIRR